MTDRMRRLMARAARSFSACENPFDPAWLEKQEVTGQECYDLAQNVARAIRGKLLVVLPETKESSR